MSSKEAIFLALKLANGSEWLTNYRLVICEYEPGHLEEQTPPFHYFKGHRKAEIDNENLTTYFEGNKQVITIKMGLGNFYKLFPSIFTFIFTVSK